MSPTVPAEVSVDAAIVKARERYAQRRPTSARLAAEANELLPGGSTRSVLDFPPFPFRVARASGARLTDVDGLEYLDLLGDYTAGLLGHDPQPVADAVATALGSGWSFGATHENEARLAQLVTDRFPSIDQVRFTNSGTEANLMAVSVARHVTGRDKVLVFDGAYHGGLLYFGASGAPLQAPFPYVVCDYNDASGVARALEQHRGDVACLLVEPMMGAAGCIPAASGFLQRLRELCTEHGVVLVFDEVMTSRMGWGGAQQRLSVHPDLTTLGKYMAGGMTFGAFGGRGDLMGAFDPARGGTLTHGGTFNNNVVTMAAGVATLEHVLTSEALEALFARGERLRDDIARVVDGAELPLSVTGWGSMMTLHATTAPVARPADLAGQDDRWKELLFLALLESGYYIARRGFIALSLAVTDADLDGFLVALQRIVTQLAAEGRS